MTDVVIRGWRPDDAASMDALLDPEPDPYWLVERAGRHGISASPDRFAITLVAQDGTDVVGVATLFENRYHPGQYPVTVEVAPGRRREGIGRLLLTALAEHRPAPLPMAGKLRDANETAIRFGAAFGMRTYQHCPVPTIEPADEATRGWAAAQPLPRHARVVALRDASRQQVVDAMVEHYQWVHAHWSPMGEREPVVSLWTRYVEEADGTLSSVAMVDDQVAALCLVWVTGDHAESVAETRTREEPYGTELVAACVARSLVESDRAGVTAVEFDGHDDDPHLPTVIDSMPRVRRDPVSLVQVSF